MEFFILRELRKQAKNIEYCNLKKKIVETLNKIGWKTLSGRMLEKDSEFVAASMEMDNTGLPIEIQIDELTTSKENCLTRADKFKYFIFGLFLKKIVGKNGKNPKCARNNHI